MEGGHECGVEEREGAWYFSVTRVGSGEEGGEVGLGRKG